MASFEPGTIVKVPFPYTKRAAVQHRPALVLAAIDGGPSLLWVAMITSAAHRRWECDVAIEDLALAGLPAASVVRPAKVATIEASVAVAMGALAPAKLEAVRAWVVRRLGG